MSNATEQDFIRLFRYRERMFAEIRRAMAVYDHWKSYEGQAALRMPGCNEGQEGEFVLAVRCYVASCDATGSDYRYRGESLSKCLDAAEADFARWVAETDEFVAQGGREGRRAGFP